MFEVVIFVALAGLAYAHFKLHLSIADIRADIAKAIAGKGGTP